MREKLKTLITHSLLISYTISQGVLALQFSAPVCFNLHHFWNSSVCLQLATTRQPPDTRSLYTAALSSSWNRKGNVQCYWKFLSFPIMVSHGQGAQLARGKLEHRHLWPYRWGGDIFIFVIKFWRAPRTLRGTLRSTPSVWDPPDSLSIMESHESWLV